LGKKLTNSSLKKENKFFGTTINHLLSYQIYYSFANLIFYNNLLHIYKKICNEQTLQRLLNFRIESQYYQQKKKKHPDKFFVIIEKHP